MKVSSTKNNRSIPTLRMIAEKSGVSQETVSHILGGKLASRYKEATRLKVLKIAEQLNYRPHRGAQAMKSGRSNLIAIVHFGAGIEAAHKTNLALSRIVNEKGFDYLAMDMNWYGGSVERTLAEIIRVRAEGVLISHIQDVFQEQHIAQLKQAGIPVVSVNGGARASIPLICDDVEHAFHALTEHLIESGSRRILQLVCSSEHLSARSARPLNHRTKGFRKAIEAHGKWRALKEEAFFDCLPNLLDGTSDEIFGFTITQDPRFYELVDKPVYRFCSRLFPLGILPDAIVCTNDFYAMEVIAAGLEHRIGVPDQLAVTGYDNDRWGEFPCFGITTAAQDIEGICSAAVNLMMEQIADPEVVDRNRKFKSEIIIRTSSLLGQSGVVRSGKFPQS